MFQKFNLFYLLFVLDKQSTQLNKVTQQINEKNELRIENSYRYNLNFWDGSSNSYKHETKQHFTIEDLQIEHGRR